MSRERMSPENGDRLEIVLKFYTIFIFKILFRFRVVAGYFPRHIPYPTVLS